MEAYIEVSDVILRYTKFNLDIPPKHLRELSEAPSEPVAFRRRCRRKNKGNVLIIYPSLLGWLLRSTSLHLVLGVTCDWRLSVEELVISYVFIRITNHIWFEIAVDVEGVNWRSRRSRITISCKETLQVFVILPTSNDADIRLEFYETHISSLPKVYYFLILSWIKLCFQFIFCTKTWSVSIEFLVIREICCLEF